MGFVMKLELKHDDLLKQPADAIINTVNCVGIMGKGIALQFKKAFPENYRAYVKACKNNEVNIGKMFVYQMGMLDANIHSKYIINFPTKKHWRSNSKIEYIEKGLNDLYDVIYKLNIKTLAMPPLGCGNGGLDWNVVKNLIIQKLSPINDLVLYLYEPQTSVLYTNSLVGNKFPKLTKVRVAICKAIERYRELDYSLSHLEIQKLMYFFELTGETRSLEFKHQQYGPYSDKLRHILNSIDGFYIDGFKDKAHAEIHIKPEMKNKIEEAFREFPDLLCRLERLSNLILGFETPFSMELLSTVHWVATHEGATTRDEIISKVQSWSPRKAKLFSSDFIDIAIKRLKDQDWI